MIPRLKPTLGWAEFFALFKPAKPNAVEQFETSFAKLMNQKHAVAFPHGRTALTYLLKALELEDKDIITPTYTCVVVPHAIVHANANPVFIDSQKDDHLMNLNAAEKAITKNTGALIPTSIFGESQDLKKLAAIQKKYPKIHIIQDAAHGFNVAGSNTQGTAAIFGLNISKLMTSIFGGMVTTDDKKLAEKIRKLRDENLTSATCAKGLKRRLYLLAIFIAFWPPIYSLVNWLERSNLLNRFVKYYDPEAIDMPADWLTKMHPIEATIGLIQCTRYPQIIEGRRRVAKTYIENLKNIPAIKLPKWNKENTWSHFTFRTDNRDALLKFALTKGIQLGELIEYSCTDLPAYQKRKHPKQKPCPHAADWAQKTVNLPLHLTCEKNIQKVIDVVKEFYKK